MSKSYNYTAQSDFSKIKSSGLTVAQLLRKLKDYPPDAYVYYEQIPAKSFIEGARVTKNMVVKDDELFPNEKQYYVLATNIINYNDNNLFLTALW